MCNNIKCAILIISIYISHIRDTIFYSCKGNNSIFSETLHHYFFDFLT